MPQDMDQLLETALELASTLQSDESPEVRRLAASVVALDEQLKTGSQLPQRWWMADRLSRAMATRFR